MPFSFPSSPTVGQTSAQNGRTYVWSGYAWDLTSNVAGHAATHAASGSDPLTLVSSQISDFSTAVAAAAPATTSASLLTSGTLPDARLSSTVTAALTNARTPTSHASSHAANGSDPLTLSASQISGLGSLATANSVAYSSLTETPTTFTPSSHTHPLSDVTQSGATTGQVATWNGSSWAPAAPAGGVSDGSKGDIVVSGSGSTWTIAAGAVTEGDLANAVRDAMFHPFLLGGM